jgi:hypothetical protein
LSLPSLSPDFTPPFSCIRRYLCIRTIPAILVSLFGS